MKTTNTMTLIRSLDKAMMENLKVYRNGSVGSEQNFVVVNHENVDAYEVTANNGIITGCTCPHAFHRNAVCKHQIKTSLVHSMDIQQLRQ
ncbi:hypothetical protein P4639_22125 [Priestia megaterium]|uniref:hypothetical protein n=1 Tax=Priestia megaterium TaxID=1404 RepID=UPI002E1D5FBB|nr:hypothetical protein [Priestia megaterium]